MLETPRLLLPPLTREHTADLVTLYSDPDVARYVGGARLTPATIPRQAGVLADEWDERGYGQSAVIERSSGAFLGRVGLHYCAVELWKSRQRFRDPSAEGACDRG